MIFSTHDDNIHNHHLILEAIEPIRNQRVTSARRVIKEGQLIPMLTSAIGGGNCECHSC